MQTHNIFSGEVKLEIQWNHDWKKFSNTWFQGQFINSSCKTIDYGNDSYLCLSSTWEHPKQGINQEEEIHKVMNLNFEVPTYNCKMIVRAYNAK